MRVLVHLALLAAVSGALIADDDNEGAMTESADAQELASFRGGVNLVTSHFAQSTACMSAIQTLAVRMASNQPPRPMGDFSSEFGAADGESEPVNPFQSYHDSFHDPSAAELIAPVDCETVRPSGMAIGHDHYREIEAAIATNLVNPHLTQVVVLYDSVSRYNGCPQLKMRVGKHLARMMQSDESLFSETKLKTGVLHASSHASFMGKFKCDGRSQGQPTYHEMFGYAGGTPVRGGRNAVAAGSAVVMANADTVFDDTASKIGRIHHGKVSVISIADGHSSDVVRHRSWVAHMYHSNSGYRYCWPDPRCPRKGITSGGPWSHFKGGGPVPNAKLTVSWDAYVFRTPLPTLNSTMLHSRVYMNMEGAENEAGRALVAAGLTGGFDPLTMGHTSPGLMRSLCGHVNLYHFHCGAKMHAVHSGSLPSPLTSTQWRCDHTNPNKSPWGTPNCGYMAVICDKVEKCL